MGYGAGSVACAILTILEFGMHQAVADADN